MTTEPPNQKPRIFVQIPGKWEEVEVRGWHGERMWVKCPLHDGYGNDGTIELNFKELNEKGRTSYKYNHSGSGYHYFTEDAKAREDAKISDILANPVKAEHYLWSYGSVFNKKTKRWSRLETWQKHRILGWTEHWLLVDVGWETGDCEEIGKVSWVDRGEIKSTGFDWAAHGHFYTKDGMAKEMKSRDDRVEADRKKREDAKKAERERVRAERVRAESTYEWAKRYTYSNGFSHTVVQNADDAKLLKVSLTASKEEILASFKSLAKVHHPDMGGNLGVFQNISAAKDRMMRRF